MKWITRSRVHVDRVACPWLITRFIDSAAEFLFVARSKVLETAEEQGAIPLDERQFAVYDALYAWCRLDVTKTTP